MQYYIVPVTARAIQVGNVSLYQKLKEKDYDLFLREEERVNLSYQRADSKKLRESGFLSAYNSHTSKQFILHGIPEKIIVVSDEDSIYELFTGTFITSQNLSYLKVFSATRDDVYSFLLNDKDYAKKITSFFVFDEVKRHQKLK